MRHVFADSFFFLALLNDADDAYAAARAYAAAEPPSYLTTEFVLVEVADAFAAPQARRQFLRLLEILASDPLAIVIPSSRPLFERGVKMFSERLDKNWSLTDCISFVVMQEHGVTEALTGDRHFEQAGFLALLKK